MRVTDLDACVSCIVADGACLPPAPAMPAGALAEAAPPAKAPPSKPAEPAAAGPAKVARALYAVQARAFRDEAVAKEYVAVLKKRGYTARTLPFRNPAGETWYRIRLGRFETLAAAQSFAAKFNRRENEQSIAVEVK